jgi:hypothetical protein
MGIGDDQGIWTKPWRRTALDAPEAQGGALAETTRVACLGREQRGAVRVESS